MHIGDLELVGCRGGDFGLWFLSSFCLYPPACAPVWPLTPRAKGNKAHFKAW